MTMTDPNGNRRTFVTGSFGVYRFEDVTGGQSYVIGVRSSRYRFNSRVVNVTDSLDDANALAAFLASELGLPTWVPTQATPPRR